MIRVFQIALVVLLVVGIVSAAPLVRRVSDSKVLNKTVEEFVGVKKENGGFVLVIFSSLVVACIALIVLVWKLKSGMRQER